MPFLQDRLVLLKSALEYLDCKKQFENIKQRALSYIHLQACFIYNFNVDIDLGCVFEHDALLGTNILFMPLESASLFQEIIYQFCTSHNLLPVDTTSTQICARLRITNFPSDSQSLQISRISDLTKYLNYQGFVRLIGVATGVSGLAKYTQSTKYICPVVGCSGQEGNHYIRIHVPGASETQTIRNDFLCMFCGENLEEVKSLRILSDKIAMDVLPIQVQDLGGIETIKIEYGQTIPIFVRDELVNDVEPGRAYEVIGICRTDFLGDDIIVTMEANNVKKLLKPVLPHFVFLPLAIQDMYDCCKESPWSFPLNLAYKFGDMITPCGSMIKFRLLLLISLVLPPQKHYLHILGVGRERRLIQSLMEYAQQFSVRSFQASVTTPLTGKVSYDKHTWAPYYIQCGSLLMSCGGVCLVGDVTGWKKNRKDQLQAALTSNKIFLDLPSKTLCGLSQQLTYSLECHVWALYDPTTSGVKTSRCMNDVFYGCDTGDLNKGFLDTFGITCFLDSGDSSTEQEVVIQMTNHILSSGCELEDSADKVTNFNSEEFQHFLAISRQLEVKLLPEAESLIHSYYTASRTARSSGLSGSDVPPSAILTLTSLAVGFAKLKLQSVVAECDALMAVYLYEENMTARYGTSLLNIQPQPHISSSRIDEYLGKQNDLAMQKFHSRVLRFCSCSMGNHSFYAEE